MNTIFQSLKIQVINQRNQLTEALDIKYSNYINKLLQQKLVITQKIHNQYDEQIAVINDMMLGHCNNRSEQQLQQSIQSIQSILDHQTSTNSEFHSTVTADIENRNNDNTKHDHLTQKQMLTLPDLENINQYTDNKKDKHATYQQNITQPKSKKPCNSWINFDALCAKCFEKDTTKAMIKCSKCFSGFHINCIKKESNRLSESYVCQQCADNNMWKKIFQARRSTRLKNKPAKTYNTANLISHKRVINVVPKQKKPIYRTRSKMKGKAPSYTFMILEAINVLGNENGCSRQRIAGYIQNNYGFRYGLATGSQFNGAIHRALTKAVDTNVLTKLSPSGQTYKLTGTGKTQLNRSYRTNNSTAIRDPNSDNSSSVYVPHMSIIQAVRLTINDKIDHRDRLGRFLEAVIIDKKDSMLKIGYAGFGDEVWSDYKKELNKFATYKSISKRPKHRFLVRKGEYYDILPSGLNEWTLGEVVDMDRYSGQVKFFYRDTFRYRYWWIHVDNEKELQPLKTKQLRSLPDKKHKDIINDQEKSKYLSLYHDKDISYFAVKKPSIYASDKQVLQTTVDENKRAALNSELYKKWQLKEEKIKSDHIEYRGEYGVNTQTLARTLKVELAKFIFENKLANEISRYHTFIDLKHVFLDVLEKKYCHK